MAFLLSPRIATQALMTSFAFAILLFPAFVRAQDDGTFTAGSREVCLQPRR
jgi:hypothetical protein